MHAQAQKLARGLARLGGLDKDLKPNSEERKRLQVRACMQARKLPNPLCVCCGSNAVCT